MEPKSKLSFSPEGEEIQERHMIIELRNVHANSELLILVVGKTY